MSKPSQDDAMLMLQLAQWGAALNLNQAMNWMWSDDFIPEHAGFEAKFPMGSEGSGRLGAIGNYFETIGTLWHQGLLNESLIFDWLAVDMVWNRVKEHFLAMREMSGQPRLYENFEALAKAETAWDAARQRG